MASTILLVDDEPLSVSLGAAQLRKGGHQVACHNDPRAALDALERESFDVVVTDLQMPGLGGIELCTHVVKNRPDIPVIVLTSHGSFEAAVQAIRAGAYDFLTKPVVPAALELAVARALRHRELGAHIERLEREILNATGNPRMLGESPLIQRVRALLGRVADADVSVLLTGETGTGKEVAARELHQQSRRKAGPFVAINCAALPEHLLESELFGHVKGAFTGAVATRVGLFEVADRGTLFLDEVGELPLSLQPKLLRVLQERVIRPVGASHEASVDVRVVAATNRDLSAAIKQGTFRQDLYYRLNVVQIELPPLRARGGDVLLLARHFIDHFANKQQKKVDGIVMAAADALVRYSWPGNVRELQNCMERAVALAGYDQIRPDDLPERVRGYLSPVPIPEAGPTEGILTLEEVEKRYILKVVEAVGNNKTLASNLLGVDRATLYRKLERYGAKGQSLAGCLS